MLGKDYEWFRELRDQVSNITKNFLIMTYVLSVCLDRTYFAKTENWKLKTL